MNKTKNVLMFGNKKQMKQTNTFLKAGICMIIAGVTTLVISGQRFYKTIYAIQSDDPTSDIIDGMFKDLNKNNSQLD